jgi:hypothetical protein
MRQTGLVLSCVPACSGVLVRATAERLRLGFTQLQKSKSSRQADRRVVFKLPTHHQSMRDCENENEMTWLVVPRSNVSIDRCSSFIHRLVVFVCGLCTEGTCTHLQTSRPSSQFITRVHAACARAQNKDRATKKSQFFNQKSFPGQNT